MSNNTIIQPSSKRVKEQKQSVASSTIVICVESGPLETQSLWLIESLRKWGGRYAKCPVVAVTPRRGLPLEKSTLHRFEELGVQWIHFNGNTEWAFYGPFNKPLALAAAESIAETDFMVWMDSDVLVVGEPSDFELKQGVDFLAHPSSCIYDVGSLGRGHDHDPFWLASLEGHGIDPDKFPMTQTQPGEGDEMRMYWQAGAFVYRRELKFGSTFLQATHDQMTLNVSSKHSGAYFHEQIGLAVGVYRQRLNYEVMSPTHNFAINKVLFDKVDTDAASSARVFHYFGSAWPECFDEFVGIIRKARPDVAEWLKSRGPLEDNRSVFKRAVSRYLRHSRKVRATRYAEECAVY